jgi:hypothetical protein
MAVASRKLPNPMIKFLLKMRLESEILFPNYMDSFRIR